MKKNLILMLLLCVSFEALCVTLRGPIFARSLRNKPKRIVKVTRKKGRFYAGKVFTNDIANGAVTASKLASSANLVVNNVRFNAQGANPLNVIGSVASLTHQRMIFGKVDTATGTATGSGFTFTDSVTPGSGTVNFNNAYASAPYIVLTSQASPLSVGTSLTASSTTSFSFQTLGIAGGLPLDATVHFIAVGQVN